jgi:hypothetical protein
MLNGWLPPANTVPSPGVYTNVPATVEVAPNCGALNAVPYTIAAGDFQLTDGVCFVAVFTVNDTVFDATLYVVVSVGVNKTLSVCVPDVFRTVPATGVYANVPATFAVAFNCAAPSVVPTATAAGVAHVITGVCFDDAFTVSVTFAVAAL